VSRRRRPVVSETPVSPLSSIVRCSSTDDNSRLQPDGSGDEKSRRTHGGSLRRRLDTMLLSMSPRKGPAGSARRALETAASRSAESEVSMAGSGRLLPERYAGTLERVRHLLAAERLRDGEEAGGMLSASGGSSRVYPYRTHSKY
jgi:hypothetical protein